MTDEATTGEAGLTVDPARGPTVECPAEGWSVSFGASRYLCYDDGGGERVLPVAYDDDGGLRISLRRAAVEGPPEWVDAFAARLGRACAAAGRRLVVEEPPVHAVGGLGAYGR